MNLFITELSTFLPEQNPTKSLSKIDVLEKIVQLIKCLLADKEKLINKNCVDECLSEYESLFILLIRAWTLCNCIVSFMFLHLFFFCIFCQNLANFVYFYHSYGTKIFFVLGKYLVTYSHSQGKNTVSYLYTFTFTGLYVLNIFNYFNQIGICTSLIVFSRKKKLIWINIFPLKCTITKLATLHLCRQCNAHSHGLQRHGQFVLLALSPYSRVVQKTINQVFFFCWYKPVYFYLFI